MMMMNDKTQARLKFMLGAALIQQAVSELEEMTRDDKQWPADYYIHHLILWYRQCGFLKQTLNTAANLYLAED